MNLTRYLKIKFSKRILITTILTVAALLVGSHPAEAGLRVNISSGTDSLWFYSTSNTFLQTGEFTVGAYSATVETTVSNFPGGPIFGTMSQTVNIGQVGASAATLTAQSWVVDDSTLGSLTAGQITDAGKLALLMAAAEKPFTSPTPFGGLWMVSSDAGSSINDSVTQGTAQTTTTVDGTGVTSFVHNMVPGNDGKKNALVPDNPLTIYYTLNQLLVMSPVNQGASSFNVTGSSSVTSVPGPAGLVLALIAAPVLGVGGMIRRKRKQVVA